MASVMIPRFVCELRNLNHARFKGLVARLSQKFADEFLGRDPGTRSVWRFALALPALLALGACAGTGTYRWAWYIFDPTDPRGLVHLRFMVDGAWATISISLVSIIGSGAPRLVVALIGMSGTRFGRWGNLAFVGSVRAVP